MNEQNALVSIIVPVYGVEEYLPACIDSLCTQSYPHLQIILVDDQSLDRCPEICDAYAKRDSRIIVIHQENKGVSGARNTGLRYATGEYIMFVDGDDKLFPQAVEIMVYDACMYDADLVWAPQKQNNTAYECKDASYVVFEKEESLLLSLDGIYNINAVWGKLFKDSLIRELWFEEGKHINEDGFFSFQCYMRKPYMVQHNVPVYCYNVRPNSCSRQSFSDKYLSMLYFCERKKTLIAEYYPQYMDRAYNMEVRTNLQMLDVLCRTTDKKYKPVQKQCIETVCRLYPYHHSINAHHKKLAWVVTHGLYPVYKLAVRMKYYNLRKSD